jgi:hypothetical protein
MKARVSRLHDGGLEPEQRFARALPAAVAKDLVRGVSGKRKGFARAGGTVLLAIAVLAGLVFGRAGADAHQPALAPIISEPENVPVA